MDQNIIHNLIRKSLNGDLKSFEVLIDEYQDRIFRLILGIVKNHATSQEITQDVFIKSWKHLNKYDFEYNFKSWLYKIAVNESLNTLKKTRVFEEYDENIHVIESDIDDIDVLKLNKLNLAIAKLNQDQRIIVQLKHFENFTYKEISQILDVPEKTVKSRLYTARMVLRNHIKGN
jgi:RNA polymerase sigma-70 factor (ECF subfamily)|tara:strand:+ start:963 stop:1487 length:525 start_codon:yes stop_codon:yes gene_type:complete